MQEGDILSVWDLLHALMLPSGNDAAIILAEYFGEYLLTQDSNKINSNFLNHRISSSAYKDISNFYSQNKLLPEIKKNQNKLTYNATISNMSNQYKERLNNIDAKDEYFTNDDSSHTTPSNKSVLKDQPKSFFHDSKSILRFIKEMNKNAINLKMNNTHYDSPHGLAN